MAVHYLDFSGLRPTVGAIRSAGGAGVLRYLSYPDPSTTWKRATSAEIAKYRAGGLDIILNYEYYSGRMLEGAAAGKADGAQAMAQAKSIGYPKGCSIYFSHDTSARNDAAVLAYMRAAQAVMGSYYLADIYSGIDVVQLCLANKVAKFGWQTIAWSAGKIGSCHIYQDGNQVIGGQADENIIRAYPLGSWQHPYVVPAPPKPAPKPPVKPTPKPVSPTVKAINTKDVPMFIYFNGPHKSSIYYVAGNQMLMLSPEDWGWIHTQNPSIIPIEVDQRSAFARLPVVPGTPDDRYGFLPSGDYK